MKAINEQKRDIREKREEYERLFKQNLDEMYAMHQTEMDTTQKKMDGDRTGEEKKLKKLVEEKEKQQKQYDEVIKTSFEDADVQIAEQIGVQQKEIERQQQQIQTYTAESGMVKNKFASMDKQKLTYSSNIATCANQIATLEEALKSFKADRSETEVEKQRRKDQISESEEKIYQKK